MRVVLAVLFLCRVFAQTAVQEAAAGNTSPATPEKPALQNLGKPMLVDFACSLDDIQSAGLGCMPDDPCPVYLELASVEAVGNRIFLAGNIHASAATLYSILLSSDDGGKSWREPYERVKAAGLDHIQFVDFENGWISGETLHPLPRDPFLLATNDGGKVWTAHPVFSEPRFGSISQFWFTSRSTGKLLVDRGESGESGRYELYETPNAGATWMLKEVNERPVGFRSAGIAVNIDWRIRADRASKSFQIERQSGDRWHSVAGFLVALKPCTPPAQPPAPQEAPAPN
ncbi:MAG: hypothetical protein U0Q18_24280 [Bryobacteraceae bacterium]